MKKIGQLLIISVIILTSCQQGADSLPELCTSVFNAIKKNKAASLEKLIPTAKGLELYYKLYEPRAFASEDEMKKDCINKAQTQRIQNKNAVENIYKTSGIDWNSASLNDFKFSVNNHTEGYQTALCYLITGGKKIKFGAIKVQDKWFMKEKPELEK